MKIGDLVEYVIHEPASAREFYNGIKIYDVGLIVGRAKHRKTVKVRWVKGGEFWIGEDRLRVVNNGKQETKSN